MPRFASLNLTSGVEGAETPAGLPCDLSEWNCFSFFFCKMFISVWVINSNECLVWKALSFHMATHILIFSLCDHMTSWLTYNVKLWLFSQQMRFRRPGASECSWVNIGLRRFRSWNMWFLWAVGLELFRTGILRFLVVVVWFIGLTSYGMSEPHSVKWASSLETWRVWGFQLLTARIDHRATELWGAWCPHSEQRIIMLKTSWVPVSRG